MAGDRTGIKDMGFGIWGETRRKQGSGNRQAREQSLRWSAVGGLLQRQQLPIFLQDRGYFFRSHRFACQVALDSIAAKCDECV